MVKIDITIPKDMRKAIGDCDKRCKEIINNFTSTLEADPVPDRIFHYTDSKGLLGILESGKIWLTDISGLNDPSEVQHGINLANEILSEKAKNAHPAAEHIADIFNGFKESGVKKSASFLVTCFSHKWDDLGQWRAYGDDGNGFTVGFDCKLLENSFVNQNDENGHIYSSFSVKYDDDKLCKIYTEIVEEVIPLVAMPEGRNLSKAIINEYLKTLFILLTTSCLNTAVYFKHGGYASEDEYRFLNIRGVDKPTDDLGYCARDNSVIRFSEFNWKDEGQQVMLEIVIGPAADEKLATIFANKCLSISGIDPDTVHIHKSDIPYRST